VSWQPRTEWCGGTEYEVAGRSWLQSVVHPSYQVQSSREVGEKGAISRSSVEVASQRFLDYVNMIIYVAVISRKYKNSFINTWSAHSCFLIMYYSIPWTL
jgi:hypothetical protein